MRVSGSFVNPYPQLYLCSGLAQLEIEVMIIDE